MEAGAGNLRPEHREPANGSPITGGSSAKCERVARQYILCKDDQSRAEEAPAFLTRGNLPEVPGHGFLGAEAQPGMLAVVGDVRRASVL